MTASPLSFDIGIIGSLGLAPKPKSRFIIIFMPGIANLRATPSAAVINCCRFCACSYALVPDCDWHRSQSFTQDFYMKD